MIQWNWVIFYFQTCQSVAFVNDWK
jgi:hypothetical protein